MQITSFPVYPIRLRHFLCLFLVIACLNNPLLAVDINSTGSAFDVETNQLIYTEHHTTSLREDGQHLMQSIYRDESGKQIYKRKIVFENGKVVEYMLRQNSMSHSESVIRTDDSIEISINNSEKIRQKIIPVNPSDEIVIDAGFSTFVVANWKKLTEGDTLKFEFVSISRMSIVGLQVKMVEQDNNSVEFAMTAANPIIRMLMTPIEVKYSVDGQQLSYYKGISNLKDTQGNYRQVEINFE